VLQMPIMILPSCTAAHAHPSYTHAAARYTAAMACWPAEPFLLSLFFLHFFSSFLSSFFFSPSELASALCSAIQRMKLHLGCGNDGSMANAFLLLIFGGMPTPHELIRSLSLKASTHGYPTSLPPSSSRAVQAGELLQFLNFCAQFQNGFTLLLPSPPPETQPIPSAI